VAGARYLKNVDELFKVSAATAFMVAQITACLGHDSCQWFQSSIWRYFWHFSFRKSVQKK